MTMSSSAPKETTTDEMGLNCPPVTRPNANDPLMAVAPRGVQLRRCRGWKKPDNTVVVTRASKNWGNPFVVGKNSLFGPVPDSATAVNFYRRWLTGTVAGGDVLAAARRVLPGRNLACFCRLEEPCHRSVLLELVNARGEKASTG